MVHLKALKQNIYSILSLSMIVMLIGSFSLKGMIQSRQLDTAQAALPEVDFDKSMQKAKYASFLKENSLLPTYEFFKELFNRNKPQRIPLSRSPRIPKKIHQIWLGSPLPEHYKKWQETWLKYHPNWEYKLWTDKDVEPFNMKNKQFFDQAKNYGERSDVWRYEILERYGGLYIDVDFECYQPFDILHHLYDFYAGLDNSLDVGVFYVNNSIIACIPHHPILEELVKNIPRQYQNRNVNTLIRTGPHFFTNVILKKIASPHYKNIIFPATYFCPMQYSSRLEDLQLNWYASSVEAGNTQQWKKPESFAVHHYTASWPRALCKN